MSKDLVREVNRWYVCQGQERGEQPTFWWHCIFQTEQRTHIHSYSELMFITGTSINLIKAVPSVIADFLRINSTNMLWTCTEPRQNYVKCRLCHAKMCIEVIHTVTRHCDLQEVNKLSSPLWDRTLDGNLLDNNFKIVKKQSAMTQLPDSFDELSCSILCRPYFMSWTKSTLVSQSSSPPIVHTMLQFVQLVYVHDVTFCVPPPTPSPSPRLKFVHLFHFHNDTIVIFTLPIGDITKFCGATLGHCPLPPLHNVLAVGRSTPSPPCSRHLWTRPKQHYGICANTALTSTS